MQKERTLIDLDKNKDNIVNLADARKALSIGGNGIDENWLKAMEPGTVFTARRKDAPKELIALDLYAVLEHKAVSSNLLQKIPDGRQLDLWFRSLEFSRKNELVEITAQVKFGYTDEQARKDGQATTPETTDGNGTGSV